MRGTKRAYRDYLNRLYPAGSHDGNRGNAAQSAAARRVTRGYGDYLYSADRQMFDADYEQWVEVLRFCEWASGRAGWPEPVISGY